MDIIQIAQRAGDAAYDRELPDEYAASEAYTVNTQAALDVLNGHGNGMRREVAAIVFEELVEGGKDAVDAAQEAAELCGLRSVPRFEIGELPDPMAVDWEALVREPEPMTAMADSRDSAEGPRIQ